ncbi:DUF2892 domain-containing protein [Microbacter sp. GSS18]|nr:DUF2892 domain-containing protein [Microbacter sp. GSS18]
MTAPRSRRRWLRVCAVTPGERVVRAVLAVFMVALAFSFGDNLIIAVPAGAVAAYFVVVAITGWCPSMPTFTREPEPEQNSLGIPEARQHIDA